MTGDFWARLLRGTLVVVGLAAVLAAGQAVNTWRPRPKPLPGWRIIRPPHAVEALAEQGDVIWAGGQEGVVAVDRKSGAVVEELEPGFSLEHVRALLVDSDGVLWVGHRRGLTRYDGGTYRTYTDDDGLPDPRVNALLEDDVGRLWVGTWGGAAVLDVDGWHLLTAEDGLAADQVEVMLEDHRGGMWFGSYVAPRGGISYLYQGAWTVITADDGLPHNNVTGFYEDGAGRLWASTGFFDRGGVAVFEETGDGWALKRVLTKKDGLAGEKAYQILEDRHGALWVGSEYDGVARIEGTCRKAFTEADGLAGSEVVTLLEDVDGNLWLGTADGLTRIAAEALSGMACKSDG